MLPRLARILLASLTVVAFAGCGAQTSEEPPLPLGPDAGGESGETPGEGPVSLSVATPALETPWDVVLITGQGPAQGQIHVDASPADGAKSYPLGSTGSFCISVRLAEGENTIRVEAESVSGERSEAKLYTVLREGELPEPPPTVSDDDQIIDRTDGSTHYNNADGNDVGVDALTLEDGDWDDMVDDDRDSYVKFTGTWANNEMVAYALPTEMKVRGFEITLPAQDGDTCGPQEIDVYLAEGPNPEMALDGSHWVNVATVSDGDEDYDADGATYERAAGASGFDATHFAIVGTNPTCHPWAYQNTYGISEVRVLAEADGAEIEPLESDRPVCPGNGAD